MKAKITYGLILFALSLCSCGTTQTIDENYAAAVAKKALSLSEPITAKPLEGGFSGAKIFTVTAGSKTYVVRFLTHKSMERRKREIHDLRVASDAGYAPHVFHADSEIGVVIMEYVSQRPITVEMRNSEHFLSDVSTFGA